MCPLSDSGRLRRASVASLRATAAGAYALLILLVTCKVDKLTDNPPPIATLTVVPTRVLDSAAVGSTALHADTLAVANAGEGTLSWQARHAPGKSWLALSAGSGTAPAKLVISLDPAGLALGVYRDTVVVSAENAAGSPQLIPVEFVVSPCAVRAVALDVQLTDSLTTRACTAPHRETSFARLYSFTAQAGDSVSIIMSSAALDGHVVLDSSAAATAAPIAQSGSCGAQPGACLRYQRLPTTRSYVVEATSADARETGIYTLSITRPHAPNAAGSLAQLRTDGTTPIPVNGSTDQSAVVLRGVVSDPDAADTLRLQVEVRPLGTAFTNTPTATSDPVANGAPASVSVAGLANNTAYHWQARTLDQTGRTATAWTPFGGNPVGAADFSTSIPVAPASPTALGQFQSDGSTAIAVGGTATGRSVIFKATVTDPNPGDQLRLEVEVKPVGTNFNEAVSGSSPAVASGTVATATVGGLSDNTAYHWRAHVVDQTGRPSPWVSFGGNLETATDFRVALPATRLVFTQEPSNATAGAVIAPPVRVAAQDPSGATIESFGGDITVGILANPGGGTLAGSRTMPAVNGVATFADLSINKAGIDYTLSAASPGLPTVTSATFDIAPGAATKLTLTTQPSATAQSGAALVQQPVVQLRDANDNAVSQAGVTVTAAIATGGGTVGGATATTTGSGVASFTNLSISGTAGARTLRFTAPDLAEAVSNTITLGAGTATQLTVTTQPSPTAQSGVPFARQPVVQLRDGAGNAVSQAGVTVTAAIASGGGALGGTATATTLGTGVATFTNLSISGAVGDRTLSFTAPELSGVVSEAITITAGSATKLAITTQPSSGAQSGVAFAQQPVIQVQDVNSNPVSQGGVVVTAVIASGPGAGTLTNATATTAANSSAASFSGLTLSGPVESYTLRFEAEAAGLTATPPSGAIALSHGVAAAIVPNSPTTQSAPVGTAVGSPPSVIVRDGAGNPVANVAVTFAVVTGGGTVEPEAPVATGVDGVAAATSWTLGAAAGSNTLTATAAGSGITGNPVTFTATGTAGGPSPAQSGVTAAPTSIPAGTGTSTITVTVRDANDNPVSGATVTLAASPTAGNTLTQPTGTTNSSGQITGTLRSTAAGPKTITATVNGTIVVTETATVTVTPGGVSASQSTVVAAPTSITVGTGTSTITVTARDEFANAISGATVVLAVDPATGSLLTQPTAPTNGDGEATGALRSTTAVPKRVSARINSVAIADTATVTVTAGSTTTAITGDAPDPSVVGEPVTVSYTVTATGGGTPTGDVTVTVTGGPESCSASVAAGSCALTPTTAGGKTITATYAGDANFGGSSGTSAHTVNPAATTTTITGDTPDPSAVGQAVSFAFTVRANAPGSGTPTGTVTVSAGGTESCSGPLTAGAGSCSITFGSAGARTVTASYAATASFAASTSAPVPHTVGAAATTTTITGDTPDPSVVGQPVTVSFTVTSPGGTPTGSVSVSAGGTESCSGPLTAGAGSCTIAFATAGSKTLTATYAATANFSGSTDTEAHTVNAAATTTTITGDTPDPSTPGQAVSFAFTVVANAPGSGTPTGTVTVSAGETESCSGPLTAGAGSCSITFGSVGARTATATYASDGNYAGSTDTEPHTVTAAGTTTAITTATPDPSVVGQAVAVSYTVTAPGGGTPTGDVTVTVSGGPETCSASVAAGSCSLTLLTAGARTFTASYAGDATFGGSADTEGHTVNPAATATTITGDTPDPSTPGQAVSFAFTVTATAPGSGTPGGTVTVSAGGTESCSGPLTAGAGSCSITFGSAGPRTVTASYPGNANFASSSDTEAHTVNLAGTTTTIESATPDPSVVGQAVTVSYTVSAPGGGTPTGDVTVTVSGGTESCSAGVAAGSCALTLTTAGPRTLTATYAGDATFGGSADTEAHTVNPAATATTITGDTPDPSTAGQPVTVTFTVAAAAPGSGTPTGNVTVSGGGTVNCVGTVAAGSCSLTWITPGPKTLTATYAGDANFAVSSSAPEPHSVNLVGTTTTITDDTPEPSVVGQPVTVSYTVTATGGGTPTGTVTVTVTGGPESCSASVAAGSCTLTPTTAGAKTLTARYAGDATHGESTSAGEAHPVNPASTTTTVAADTPNPYVTGQSVSFTFTVAVNTPGSGTPTGTVTVSAGGTESCNGTVAAGSCSIAFSSPGERTVRGTYAGDPNFAMSTSSGAAYTVDRASTTTTIASTPNPSETGQSVTFNYTVAVSAPGGGTPTGNVTVSAGAQNCSASVAAGSCSITFSSAGERTATAAYAGDANFAGSTSAGLAHTVNAASTATTITGHAPDPSIVNEPVTVTYTVTATSGTPTGNVTVSDGTVNCVATVGAGTCSLTPTTAGTKSLIATYDGDGNFGASFSAGVTHTVNAAPAATKLAITTQPSSSAQSGAPFVQQPVIQVQDANGNPVNQGGVVVTAVIATPPSGGTLTNATATTAASSGAATFSGLTLSGTVGSYTLRFEAAAAGLTATPGSGAIALSAGAVSPSVSTLTADPTSIAPTTGGSTITVTARDANGNPINGAAVLLSVTGGGTFTPSPNGTTNTSGVMTATFSSDVPGSKTVSARANNVAINGTATVEVTTLATSGQWSGVSSAPIVQLHLHLLPNGKVLSWGHAGEPQVWDPATGGFTAVPSLSELFCAGHDFLPDGRLLVTGGHIADGVGLPNTNVFDPATQSWQAGPAMAKGRWYPTNTTLPNGHVVTIAGTDESGAVVTIPEVWDGVSWRQLTTASLALEYYPRTFVAPDGRIFYAGEQQPSRWLDVTGTGNWTNGPPRNFSGWRNYGSAVMYEPWKILYVGGGDPPTNTAEIINLNQPSPAWTFTGSMTYARRQLNATLLPTGEVLVTGGTSGPGLNDVASAIRVAELWNPTTGTWTQLARNAVSRVYHSTTLLLPDGRVLHTGSGDGAGAPNELSYELFSPPYFFKGARPSITGATPLTVAYGQNLLVGTPQAASITKVTFIRLSSVTHAFDQGARLVPLSFSQAPGGLSVTIPPSRNAAPPGPYMLFLVNGNGVPSEARIMRLQ